MLLLIIWLILLIIYNINKDYNYIGELWIFLILMWSTIGFISLVLEFNLKEWMNIKKTKIYNPKLIGLKINWDTLTMNSNEWIQWFVKNSKNWKMKYKFIPYGSTPYNGIKWEIKIKIINDKLEENNIPYGLYETQTSCVKHWLTSFIWLLVYPWVLTCDDNKTFIISKSTFLWKKNNNN